MKIIDLRSDTVTRPSDGMRKAMAKAEVGDDVYGEDPSVNRLQDLAAKLSGKKAALFLPSGTMGNLIPIYINCGRGNEILAHERSHILHYEMTSAAAVAGAMPVAIPGHRGILTQENLSRHLRPDIYYMPRVAMVEVENSHNAAGGTVYRTAELKEVSEFARKHSLKIHMDGARIFNAAIAAGEPVKKICTYTDTVTFCLSKGLGAPVGAMLCGSHEFIAEAKRVRKMLGGGMRQAGILAAAGIHALEHNVQRLAEDHTHAKKIAETLDACSWADIDPTAIETNIVYVTTAKAAQTIVTGLKKHGILCGAAGPRQIRLVTHLGLCPEDIDKVCDILGKVSFS